MPSAFIPSRLGYPAMHLAMQPVHQRSVHPGPLVLRTAPLRYPTPTPDRDRTVSRRSEPSSRTALMGEQPNPWDLLQPRDAMSRHRGAKPLRRCELLGVISLLSQGSFLSVERWQSHFHTTGSLSPTFVPAPPVGVAVKLPSAFALFEWFPTILREPLSASDTLSEATAPVKLPTRHCPPAGSRLQVRSPVLQGWYPNIDSDASGDTSSQSPTYPVHAIPNPSIKLE